MKKVYITEIKTKDEYEFKLVTPNFYETIEDARKQIEKSGDVVKLENGAFKNHLEFYTSCNGLFIHTISELTLA